MLRLAKKTDQDLIKEIHRQCKKEIGNFNTYFIWDNFLSGKSSYKYYIFQDCGMVRLGWSKKTKTWTVYDIGFLIEHRGNGYGRNILLKLPRPLMLKCNLDNINGNKFYESIGMLHKGIVQSKNKKNKMNLWIFQ
jgi:hypothetical protein